MEDTVLEKGQTAKLSLSCRNNSTVSVKKVEAKLIQITSWYAGGHTNEKQRILQEMSFESQGLDRKVKCLRKVNPRETTRFKFWKSCAEEPILTWLLWLLAHLTHTTAR